VLGFAHSNTHASDAAEQRGQANAKAVERVAAVRRIVAVDGVPHWRVGVDVRSTDVGAAAAFDQIVDFDDRPTPVPGLVDVLHTWLWQDGPDTRCWLGALVEARSATSAAERVASVVEARTAGVRTRAMTIHATASTARTLDERVHEEEVDLHAIPGSTSPFIVPVRARAYVRNGARLTIEWTSEGRPPLSHVTVAVTESLVIGLFEHRPPLTGPDAAGYPMIAVSRHVVVEVGDIPVGLPVLDRYSGEYLSEGNDHPEAAPIKPFIYAADGPDVASR
jgi:hypothetical protein